MKCNKLCTAVGLIILLLTTAGYAGSGDVTVSGTVTAKAFITEKEPLLIKGVLSFSNGKSTATTIMYQVPSGQRYVIESFSLWGTVYCAFDLIPNLSLEVGGNHAEFFFPKPDSTYIMTYMHHGAWPIKLYADSGSTIVGGGIRSAWDCAAEFKYNLSGYLEYQEQHRLP